MRRGAALGRHVQALVKRGDQAAAHDVVERFLASHPSSPHEQKMRRLLETNH